MVNEVPSSSSSHVSGDNNGNKILILPKGDEFDQHKLVVETIASIMRSNLVEAKSSWKKLSIDQRDSWFDIFKSKFTWPPQYNDTVRRNFEKRGKRDISIIE
ncbi:golgin subfamily A member 5 [Spatholobus suberectus]|nr:golgin subfamily A member 5 [Spatholobus suberectus]